MKKYTIFSALVMILILTSCASIGMDYLPEGELMKTVYSPDKAYKVNSFIVSGNSTVDFSVRCEVVEISSGKSEIFIGNTIVSQLTSIGLIILQLKSMGFS